MFSDLIWFDSIRYLTNSILLHELTQNRQDKCQSSQYELSFFYCICIFLILILQFFLILNCYSLFCHFSFCVYALLHLEPTSKQSLPFMLILFAWILIIDIFKLTWNLDCYNHNMYVFLFFLHFISDLMSDMHFFFIAVF